MACEMCDHTMQNLGMSQSLARVFWCPRCGSLKTINSDGFTEIKQPMLCKRIQDSLVDTLDDGRILVSLADWRNIDEASGFRKGKVK